MVICRSPVAISRGFPFERAICIVPEVFNTEPVPFEFHPQLRTSVVHSSSSRLAAIYNVTCSVRLNVLTEPGLRS